jgi:Family of unknown function (DUF6113)
VRNILVAGAAALAAFVVAVLAGVVSREAWRGDGFVVPWGLTLGVAASASVVVLGRADRRATGFAAAAGWVVGLMVLLAGRPEGDYVVASDWLGAAFLVTATLVVAVTAGWKQRAPR